MNKYKVRLFLSTALPRRSFRSCGIFLLSFFHLYSQTFNEDLVKSQFLVHFGDFVSNRINNESLRADSLKIGVVGPGSIPGRILDYLDQSNLLHEVSVGLIEHPDQLHAFDILYFSSGKKEMWEPYLPKARSTGVLTVGEEHGFADSGGVIELVVRKNRLRFRLNLEAAHESGLQINAKLIKLALQEAA